MLNNITGTFKTLSGTLGKVWVLLTGKIGSLADRQQVPEEKRRPILFIFGGAFAFFLILLIIALVVNSRGPKKSSSVDMSAVPVIPQEDLFIPAEPDFLPKLLPEREPRLSWSFEDVRPYWRNPEKAEFWRDEIKSAVDKLMEGVP